MKNAYERFLAYIKIETTSDEKSTTVPTSDKEFDLARVLKQELVEMGMENVQVDEKCYVYAFLSPTKGYEDTPRLGFVAHMDTSPAVSGKDVKANEIKNYDVSDITLPKTGEVMRVSEFPFLKDLRGQTLITTDGTTLLGADDKAGVAEIMAAMEEIIQEKIPHGFLGVCFTPDEEVGEGADYFDIEKFSCDFAYTVDGSDTKDIECENFNAAQATVEVTGFSAHPGEAKDVMENALKIAMEFDSFLPQNECPEKTEKREGFYHLMESVGDVCKSTYTYIIRDFDMESFEMRKEKMLEIAGALNQKYKKSHIEVNVSDSYLNMIEKIKEHPHLIENAKKAIEMVGLTPVIVPIRGGTDGARLSFMGLPCPNLGTGGMNFHSKFEVITKEKLLEATKIIKNLVVIYSDKSSLK